MTLYLINNENRPVFEVSVWVKTDYDSNGKSNSYVEVSATVNITNYSKLLLDNIEKKNKIIHDFDILNEIRGWLWDRYFMVDGTLDDVIDKLKTMLTKVAKDYKLNLIID